MRENFTLYVVPFSYRRIVLVNPMLHEKGMRYAISFHIDEDSSDRILKILQELSKPSAVGLIKRIFNIAHCVLSQLFY